MGIRNDALQEELEAIIDRTDHVGYGGRYEELGHVTLDGSFSLDQLKRIIAKIEEAERGKENPV